MDGNASPLFSGTLLTYAVPSVASFHGQAVTSGATRGGEVVVIGGGFTSSHVLPGLSLCSFLWPFCAFKGWGCTARDGLLSGRNFGAAGHAARVTVMAVGAFGRFDPRRCEVTVNHTEITCETAPGVGKLDWTVEVGACVCAVPGECFRVE